MASDGTSAKSVDLGESVQGEQHSEECGHAADKAASGEGLQESLGQAWRALSNLASTVAVKVNS